LHEIIGINPQEQAHDHQKQNAPAADGHRLRAHLPTIFEILALSAAFPFHGKPSSRNSRPFHEYQIETGAAPGAQREEFAASGVISEELMIVEYFERKF
jgi:hypothetical protein